MAQQLSQPVEKPSAWPQYNFCFTYNNYTEIGEAALIQWLTGNTKYAVFGHEVAPTTGTPHLQGYFSLKKKMRMSTIQNQLKEVKVRLSLLRAKGTAEENLVYCTKADPDGFYQHGTLKNCGSGARAELIELSEKIKSGHKMTAIAYQHPVEYIRYHKGLHAFKSLTEKMNAEPIRDITTTVYWGIGGAGKTYRAREDCLKLGLGEPYFMMNPNNNSIWFDNYDGERGLIIDDFYGWIKPHILFRYLDKYLLQLPIKGSTTYANWTHVWITSNKHPKEWYNEVVFVNLDKHAYYRRLHNVYFCTKNDDDERFCQTEQEDKPLVFDLPAKPHEDPVDEVLEDFPFGLNLNVIPSPSEVGLSQPTLMSPQKPADTIGQPPPKKSKLTDSNPKIHSLSSDSEEELFDLPTWKYKTQLESSEESPDIFEESTEEENSKKKK